MDKCTHESNEYCPKVTLNKFFIREYQFQSKFIDSRVRYLNTLRNQALQAISSEKATMPKISYEEAESICRMAKQLYTVNQSELEEINNRTK